MSKKIVRLTEKELKNIIKKVVVEQMNSQSASKQVTKASTSTNFYEKLVGEVIKNMSKGLNYFTTPLLPKSVIFQIQKGKSKDPKHVSLGFRYMGVSKSIENTTHIRVALEYKSIEGEPAVSLSTLDWAKLSELYNSGVIHLVRDSTNGNQPFVSITSGRGPTYVLLAYTSGLPISPTDEDRKRSLDVIKQANPNGSKLILQSFWDMYQDDKNPNSLNSYREFYTFLKNIGDPAVQSQPDKTQTTT